MVNDLAERLRSAMCPGSERCNVLTCYPDCECGIMEAAAARIEALEEALKPFSEFAFAPMIEDDDTLILRLGNVNPESEYAGLVPTISAGDLRRAARAYANKGEPT